MKLLKQTTIEDWHLENIAKICYDSSMGKNASKNFVNQFKNTRRQAGQTGRRPLVGQAFVEQRKLFKGQAGGRPLVGPVRHLKKPLPGERQNGKNSNRGDK